MPFRSFEYVGRGEAVAAGDERGQAHKIKQATRKHLALLASLGKFGLSEHMALEADLPCAATGAGRRTVKGIGTDV